jgi:hypothetical protein
MVNWSLLVLTSSKSDLKRWLKSTEAIVVQKKIWTLPFFRSADRSETQQTPCQSLQAINEIVGATRQVLVTIPPEDPEARGIVLFMKPGRPVLDTCNDPQMDRGS